MQAIDNSVRNVVSKLIRRLPRHLPRQRVTAARARRCVCETCANGFLEEDWAVGTIEELLRAMPSRDVVTIDVAEPLSQAITLFKQHGYSQLPVTDDGKLAGILTESDALRVIVEGNADISIAEAMVRQVSTVAPHASASELPRIFERGEVALVVNRERAVVGIVTKLDLIEHLTRRPSV